MVFIFKIFASTRCNIFVFSDGLSINKKYGRGVDRINLIFKTPSYE